MSSARDHALHRLDQTALPGWPEPILRRPFPPPADPRDFALAEQITIGVIKNHLHLLHLQSHYSGRKLKAIHPLVQKILSIALYQIRFLTRIPPSAAVNEAVTQSKRLGQSKASGFVNAVLRNSLRDPNPPPPTESDPAAYAEQVLSHPRDLFEKLAHEFGDEIALNICRHSQLEPPTIIRTAETAGLAPPSAPDTIGQPPTLIPHETPGLFIIPHARPALLAHLAETGQAQVQDPTSALVVPQLDLHPRQLILDRCCGLGTKTLQIHDLLQGQCEIHAVDPSLDRTRTLINLLKRRQITTIHVHPIGMLSEKNHGDKNRDVSGFPSQRFDRILIDAPCSNSGVLARRPEARYHQFPANLASLAKLQDRILDDTAPHLKPAGRLVYSTCSVFPEENRARVDAFLQRNPGYFLLHDHLTLPSFTPAPEKYHDGGYYAVMIRA